MTAEKGMKFKMVMSVIKTVDANIENNSSNHYLVPSVQDKTF